MARRPVSAAAAAAAAAVVCVSAAIFHSGSTRGQLKSLRLSQLSGLQLAGPSRPRAA